MSYVIHLFSGPMPRTLDDAVQQASHPGEHPRGQNALFIKLAQALTKRYPCITEIDEEDEETPSVWTDGPLNGQTSSTVYVLGVVTDWVDEVQPFVVETATSLGLHVLDHQQGLAYLAGGKVLGPQGESVGNHLGVPLYGQLSHAMIERTLNDALLPLLLPLGFEFSRVMGGLWRAGSYGSQWLRYVPLESSPEVQAFDMELILHLGNLSPVFEYVLLSSSEDREKYVGTACCPLATACRFFRLANERAKMSPTIRFEVSNLDELRTLAIALRQLFARHLNQLLDTWTTAGNIAYYLYAGSHDAWRILGSRVSFSDDGYIHKSTIAGNLLTTAQCSGEMAAILLGTLAKVPYEMLEERITKAYQAVERLPSEQQAQEKAKLDMMLKFLIENGKYPVEEEESQGSAD